MKEHEKGRPQGQLTTQPRIFEQEPEEGRLGRPGDAEPSFLPVEKRGYSGRSHQELVEGFKGFLAYWQDRLYQDHQMHFSPLQIIRNNLGWYKDLTNEQTRAFVTPLALAWNVLSHDRYELGTSGEQSTGMELQMYYQAIQNPAIKLSEPQVEILDALVEACGIPHERGQTEIEIPDKLKNYSTWFHSEEYQRRVVELRRQKKKG